MPEMPRSFGPSNRSLFIRNVAEVTRSEDLRNLFGEYGTVTDVYIPHDYYTHRPRGFAYVQFDELRAAEEAVHNLDRVRLFGRELEVEFAQGDRKTPTEMRGKERGPPFRSGAGSRRYSRRDDRRRRSRSRSRDRTSKRHRSRHRSRSRSRSPNRSSHRHRHHSHSRSRSKSNSKSRKGHEHRHHSSSQRRVKNNNKESNEYKLGNDTNDVHIEDQYIQESDVVEREGRHSTNTSPSSIERTNGDKRFSDESKDGSIGANSQT